MASDAAVAARLNRLGLRCKAAARYDAGRAHYERALALLTSHPAPDLDAVATLYHNLGGIEHADPCDLAADRSALAAILDGQARYDEAEGLYREALRAFRGRHGSRDWDIAVTLGNLGAQYVRRGRLPEAARLLRRAATLKSRILGPADPGVAVALNNLALALRQSGDSVRAAALYRRAVGVLERSLGAGHPWTITCRANAARCGADAGGGCRSRPVGTATHARHSAATTLPRPETRLMR